MLRVVVEKSGEILQDGVFRKDLISLGRDTTNDVVIEDPYISGQHVIVRHDEDHGFFRLFDQSHNGTFWQGERVSTLRFDTPTVVKISAFQITLIPIVNSGTEDAPVIDLFAHTAVENLPQGSDVIMTAQYKSVQRKPAVLPDGELRSISSDGELKMLVFFGEAVIGRAPECDLQFGSVDISRRHALIFPSQGGYSIRRLSKKNALLVNDREVPLGESMPLKDGDVIRICDEEIVFLCPATQPRSVGGQTVPLDASPNLDLALNRRACADSKVIAFDVVGFLGSKTWQKFEEQLTQQILSSRRMLIDLGYLSGIDREGIQSLGRVISEAEKTGVKIQFIRVTPRIADLLSYSQLKQMLTSYISKSEETAIRRLNA
ncbi:MAG TPA: FHA domain-containing protein [Thermoanaerobaculia bacterium]|nr:FHA domain-containing protein [Thermoanaerobaculia bacterium]